MENTSNGCKKCISSNLQETVYISQPSEFIYATYPNHICKLKKSFVRLKQDPRAWFDTFRIFFMSKSFTSGYSDSSMFVLNIGCDILVLLLYVDDMFIMGSLQVLLDNIIVEIKMEFSKKDIGNLHYFIGVQVEKTTTSLLLSQYRYLNKVLGKAHMLDCRPIATLMTTFVRFDIASPTLTDATKYRMIVGSLQYITFTRPEITFVVNCV